MPTSPRRARRRGTPLASLCEAAQCSHWVVRRSVAEVSALRADGGRDKKEVGRDRAVRPYTRLLTAFAPSVRADVGIRPYEITGGVCVIRTGGQSRPPLRTVYRTCALSLPCHSEPVTDVTGVGIRSPFHINGGLGRHLPLPLRGKGAI